MSLGLRGDILGLACGLLLPLGWLDAASAQGQSLVREGPARAIDGDGLMVGAAEVRLFGIDAPELSQQCVRGSTPEPCGRWSRTVLEDLVRDQTVRCEGRGFDRNGRLLGICTIGRLTLNEELVRRGAATSFSRYSTLYAAAEQGARSARRGIWGTRFERPEDYRHGNGRPPQMATPPATGCAIKGNRSRRGELIYHLPGRPYYDQVRAERMFCSAAEAEAAGYRRSLAR